MRVDVAVWLHHLGLQQYERAFRDNAIDGDILAELTDESLKELGLPLGHRLKLLKAISALRPDPAPAGAPAAPGVSSPDGERRQVAVLFADLAGYTELTSEIDAERVHDLLGRFFDLADRAIEDHGGRIDKHIGDCVMAVFGAPVAHGNDTERAVRAALAIRNYMAGLSTGLDRSIAVHIGIAAGQVIASGTGSTRHREYTVTGETVNLASRLTEAAVPGEILVSDKVWRTLADRLEGVAVGALAVKGFAEPVQAWRAVALKPVVTATGTRFVGRRAELQQFEAMLSACRDTGRGQAVHLRGEAGIGKTRLVGEIRRRARESGFVCHGATVLDFGSGMGRDAVRTLARDLLGLDGSSEGDSAQAAIAVALAEGLVGTDQVVFLYDLLDVAQPGDLRALFDAMDNRVRSSGKRQTLVSLAGRASRRRPRLLVFEDVHWADPQILEELAALTAGIADCPALLVMTSRLDGDPLDHAWRSRIGGSSLTTIDLGPLRREEAVTLVGALLDSADGLAARCLQRAAGNPLFLEQLLYQAEAGDETDVPGSVQSLVQARVDRLKPTDKLVLQVVSALGQRFDADVLAHMLGCSDYSPESLIEHLLVRREGDGFLFSHALIRDAVYDSLLKSRQRELHSRAAAWFDGRDPALHAEHLDRAEDPAAAGAYLAAARTLAAEYRYEAALRLVVRGRALAARPADRFGLARFQGELLHDLGAMRDAEHAYSDALAAAENGAERCGALIGSASVKRVTDDLEGAFADLELAETDAVACGLIAEQTRIHFLRGNLLFPRGDIEGCLQEHRRSLDLARESDSAELEAAALGGLGDAEYLRGHMLTAHDYFRACVELARRSGLGRIEVANQSMLGITRMYAGDSRGALEEARAAIASAARLGHARAEMTAQHCAYFCLRESTDFVEAWPHVERALELSRQLEAPRFEAEALAFRAELRRLTGHRPDALEDIGEALSISRRTGMAYMGPIILAIFALATEDQRVREETLTEGEALLAAGSVSHNHLLFRRDAIDVCLEIGDWDRVGTHASALEGYARAEPTPWSDYVVARGRALAAWGCGRWDAGLQTELARLRDEGQRFGYLVSLPRIVAALGG